MFTGNEDRNGARGITRFCLCRTHGGEIHYGPNPTSFWFPRMEERVREYCSSCPICQLRAPVKVAHRVPIQAIPRNDELQFNSIVADCIGPLINVGDSTAPKPLYNFALVLVDRYSR